MRDWRGWAGAFLKRGKGGGGGGSDRQGFKVRRGTGRMDETNGRSS